MKHKDHAKDIQYRSAAWGSGRVYHNGITRSVTVEKRAPRWHSETPKEAPRWELYDPIAKRTWVTEGSRKPGPKWKRV